MLHLNNQSAALGRAETAFREAFDRLKAENAKTRTRGTYISQNDVAREANRDPSALKKTRFPELIAEIKNFNQQQTAEVPAISAKQALLASRRKNKILRDRIAILKSDRDLSQSVLLQMHRHLVEMESELESLKNSSIKLVNISRDPRK